MLRALDIAPPAIFWPKEEIAIDAFHHAAYVAVTGIAYQLLRSSYVAVDTQTQSIGATMSHTENHPHQGTFGDGTAHPESFAGEEQVGTFAEGTAHPETFAGEDHVGTFADGTAHTESFEDEAHVGTFAEGDAVVEEDSGS